MHGLISYTECRTLYLFVCCETNKTKYLIYDRRMFVEMAINHIHNCTQKVYYVLIDYDI